MNDLTNGEWVAIALVVAVIIFLIRNRKSVKQAVTSGSWGGGGSPKKGTKNK